MHGKDAVIEEILDWRPYDYVTDRTILATPSGPLKVLHTIELEPTTTGHDDPHALRGAEDQAGDARSCEHDRPRLRRTRWRCALPGLVAQLDAELAARRRTAAPSRSWLRRGRTAPCRGFSRW